jgi:hypothetical protein
MTWLDEFLQQWRIRIALSELPPVPRVLDIGTRDGTLFRLAGASGVGIDPELADAPAPPGVTLVKGLFPVDLPKLPGGSFDAATALAVVEHVPDDELVAWPAALGHLMASGGVLVITVPTPTVDTILHMLMRLHMVAGMEAHQHHGFRPGALDAIFAAPMWRRRKHRTFELGLNNLYVFERTPYLTLRGRRRQPPRQAQATGAARGWPGWTRQAARVTRNIAKWLTSGTASSAALCLRRAGSMPGSALRAAASHGIARI